MHRTFFDVNVGWMGGGGRGGTEECGIGQREEREEWKDEEKVNEESDAPGNFSLAPDIHTNAHS